MGRNYELKRIDEDIWEKTPEKIQLKRRRYSQLRDDIIDSKKKIKDLQIGIKKLKDEKRDWEKEKIELYHQLVTFQEESIPSVSPTVQKGKNFQWSINLKYGGLKRKKYLGSNLKVRKKLDEIKNTILFVSRIEHRDDLMEECREEIRGIIEKNLMNEMRTEKEQVILLKKWKKDELNMWDYLK
ncbi:hypothetical protein [Maribacter sp. Asnod1-A12]|uniref:hypothetical protein n=1 Tax=Maribacter sp. Asnod1-A12 TaxID=3160576 RepID=UPI0038660C96